MEYNYLLPRKKEKEEERRLVFSVCIPEPQRGSFYHSQREVKSY